MAKGQAIGARRPAAHWARTEGRFDAYHAAIFRAFFERGEDIGDAGVLASLATGLGLDGEALRHTLDSRQFEKSVIDDEQEGGVREPWEGRLAAISLPS